MNEVETKLNQLKYEDIYSIILFALAELRKSPEYKTISELSYILDKNSLIAFFEYFGGMTIKVPTMEDFKLVINALLLYEYINIEKMTFTQALKELNEPDLPSNDLKKCYNQIVEILKKYDFKRGN